MGYPSLSRRSYRNALIAAGLAAGLGVGAAAYAETGGVVAAPWQPPSDDQVPAGPVDQRPSSQVAAQPLVPWVTALHQLQKGLRR
jgi:hypothetical protein